METPDTDIDMTGWSDEDKLAFAAAKQEADDASQTLTDELAEINGTPAQAAVKAEKERAERARVESKKVAREKAEKVVIDKLRAQFGKKVSFIPTKEGLIAVRHPSMNSQHELQARLEGLPRKQDKIAIVHDAIRELIEYPTKPRVKEIEKIYPMILSEVNAKLDEDMTGRDYSARPID